MEFAGHMFSVASLVPAGPIPVPASLLRST
jgi:hypothetical protein